MTQQPTIEEFMALQQALQTSLSQQEKLTSELRFVSTERDLFKQRLDKMLRKFFAAKSEARGTEQKDMFFNEAEALAAAAQVTPALQDGVSGEDSDAAGWLCRLTNASSVDASHLMPICRVTSCATNCLNPNAFVRMMVRPSRRLGSRLASSWTSSPSKCA